VMPLRDAVYTLWEGRWQEPFRSAWGW